MLSLGSKQRADEYCSGQVVESDRMRNAAFEGLG